MENTMTGSDIVGKVEAEVKADVAKVIAAMKPAVKLPVAPPAILTIKKITKPNLPMRFQG
jgi:hypothetical protein